MSFKRRLIAALLTGAVLVGVPSAAYAGRVTATVSSKAYLGFKGISGVYKVYTVTAGNKKFCVISSSNSLNDPGTNDYTRIIVRQGSTQQFGGYGSFSVGDSVQADVLDGHRPPMCAYDIATLMYVNK